ncbi:MAG: hypothetical protein HY825_18020 [Acidobacteria bacterium]|nr:hypothetical protein [Acidobacteriota bacterium]
MPTPRSRSLAPSLVLLATILSSAAEARHGTQFIGSMEFGGQERHWLVNVPASYDGSRAIPLVVRLHAAGGHFNSTEEHGWFPLSDQAGFILVLPNGSLPSGTDGGLKWNVYSWDEGPDDVGFLAAVIERLRQQFRVDARRIFMTGHSNGASMTNTFAFAHAEMLAAIAPAQGAWVTALGLDPLAISPQPGVPLPVWIWRGETENDLVGVLPRNLQDRQQQQFWSGHDGCPAMPEVRAETDGRFEYATEVHHGCRAEVRFTEVRGKGHEYEPEYSVKIWNEFFVRQVRAPTGRSPRPRLERAPPAAPAPITR